jgi:protoporphyrinogen oxidase
MLNTEIPPIKIEYGIPNNESRIQKNEKHHSTFTILNSTFDRILFTTPTPIANKLMPDVAPARSLTIPHLHAQVLILETKEPVLKDIYWLSVTDRSYPFLAVVAHTNFMDKKHYGGNHITYIGNYLPPSHPFLSLSKEQLLKKFQPFIQKITSGRKLSVLNSYLFTGLYAQPVHGVNYSRTAPGLVTKFPGVFLANMDSIFPWDRGTNYAVDLGQKAATAILSSMYNDVTIDK